jgi:hypothetical protein
MRDTYHACFVVVVPVQVLTVQTPLARNGLSPDLSLGPMSV